MTSIPAYEHAIDVQQLHKSFGDNEVLKGIDFHVDDGEVVCVIGPSGSGKSTLLRCVNRLEVPTKGRVLVEGVDMTDPETDLNDVRSRIGMVFQSFNLFPHMTVLENCMLAPMKTRKVTRAEAEATAGRIAEGAPLANRATKKFLNRLLDPTPLTREELDEAYELCDSEDYAEGMRAFLAKEKPDFKGR